MTTMISVKITLDDEQMERLKIAAARELRTPKSQFRFAMQTMAFNYLASLPPVGSLAFPIPKAIVVPPLGDRTAIEAMERLGIVYGRFS